MIWQTTQGITIEVSSKYEAVHSKPSNGRYVHSYQINIINDTQQAVQLLRRHWYIYDADSTMREVEGMGVIGEQPIIRPGHNHSYTSWSPIHTAIGKMKGYYTMMIVETGETFKVEIPEFKLIAEHKLN